MTAGLTALSGAAGGQWCWPGKAGCALKPQMQKYPLVCPFPWVLWLVFGRVTEPNEGMTPL